MVDKVPDLHFHDTGQCFPRYVYSKGQTDLASGDADGRQDNIPPQTVALFRSHYKDTKIDSDDIFYYVYGILHSPAYRSEFAADLRKMLPHIPFASSLADFRAFSRAGQELSHLHLGYEQLDPYPLKIDERNQQPQLEGMGDPDRIKDYYKLIKMRFGGKARSPDKTQILYNHNITIEGIPPAAYDYQVNGKSALGWLIYCYELKTDKESKITQDPNDWSDNPRYILELIPKIVRLSIDTMKIVQSLPELDFKTKT